MGKERSAHLSAASVPGTASRSSTTARGTCGDGCLGAPCLAGLPVHCKFRRTRDPVAGHSLAAPMRPPASLPLGTLAWSCFPAPRMRREPSLSAGVRGSSALRCWCLQRRLQEPGQCKGLALARACANRWGRSVRSRKESARCQELWEVDLAESSRTAKGRKEEAGRTCVAEGD